MANLFEIASGLSQYKPSTGLIARGIPSTTSNVAYHNNQEDEKPFTSLSILDETLRTIYEARQIAKTSDSPAKTNRSLPPLILTRASAAEHHSATSRVRKPSASSPVLTTVFARSLSLPSLSEPPPSSSPPPGPPTGPPPGSPSNPSLGPPSKALPPPPDPDLTAKALLRQLTDEIEHIPHETLSDLTRLDQLQRYLTNKFIDSQLHKLPRTPFVLLVRKKVTQKIEQLAPSVRSSTAAAPAMASNQCAAKLSAPNADPSDAIWSRLSTLTPEQHRMLQKLAQFPETQYRQLSKAQQELWQFAKRYTKMLTLTPAELAQLPSQHKEILRRLQQQHSTSS